MIKEVVNEFKYHFTTIFFLDSSKILCKNLELLLINYKEVLSIFLCLSLSFFLYNRFNKQQYKTWYLLKKLKIMIIYLIKHV